MGLETFAHDLKFLVLAACLIPIAAMSVLGVVAWFQVRPLRREWEEREAEAKREADRDVEAIVALLKQDAGEEEQ